MHFLVLPLNRSSTLLVHHFSLVEAVKATRPQISAGRLSKLFSRATQLADKQWREWEKAPLNSVKHRIHSFGTRLLDVVDEEEVFLRQIPQIPHLLHPGEESTLRIPLWHYSSATAEHTAALKHLSELASDRIAIHRRRTILCTAMIPFSMACIILPGPNLPLAYNIFRLFCNYKALHGSRTLAHLLQHSMVVPEHDPRITTWLHAYTPSNASTDVDGNANVTVVDTSPEAMEKVQELEIGGEHLVEDIQRNVRRWNRLKEEGKLGLHSVSSATEGVSSSSSKKGN